MNLKPTHLNFCSNNKSNEIYEKNALTFNKCIGILIDVTHETVGLQMPFILRLMLAKSYQKVLILPQGYFFP